MTAFYTITNNVMNLNNNNVFSLDYDKTDIPGIYKLWFSILISTQGTLPIYKHKFSFLDYSINGFYFKNKSLESDVFLNYFCHIQKIYCALNRFAFRYKYNKSKLIVTADLQLNEISLQDKNVICIYQNDARYLFRMEDLLKMVYMALTNTYLFFAEPVCVKNPYNNIPFSKAILYYIYINLITNTNLLHIKQDYLDLFLKYKQCHFNMTLFVNRYEYILKDYSFKNYLNNTSTQALKDDILVMIRNYNNTQLFKNKRINIHKSFPVNVLIRIMKPYLYLKLMSEYSLIKGIKLSSKLNLNKKLSSFQQFNPQFGRKNVQIQTVFINDKLTPVKTGETFNTKHKKFNITDTCKFMKNHLSYDYNPNDNFIAENDYYISDGSTSDDDTNYDDTNDDDTNNDDTNNDANDEGANDYIDYQHGENTEIENNTTTNNTNNTNNMNNMNNRNNDSTLATFTFYIVRNQLGETRIITTQNNTLEDIIGNGDLTSDSFNP